MRPVAPPRPTKVIPRHPHPLTLTGNLQRHNCNLCTRLLAPPFDGWRCQACDFDVCERCMGQILAASMPTPPAVPVPRPVAPGPSAAPPSGPVAAASPPPPAAPAPMPPRTTVVAGHPHALTFMTKLERHGCNSCNKPLPPPFNGWRCTACDFDMCEQCLNAQEVIGSMESFPIVIAGHPHPLSFATKLENHTCDACRRPLPAPFNGWRCGTCDFDVCEQCIRGQDLAGDGGHARLLNDANFLERLALAADRMPIVKETLPHSEDAYFFHTLMAQLHNNAPLEEKLVDQLCKSRWYHHNVAREMKLRHKLRRYGTADEKQQQKIAQELREELGVNLSHNKQASRASEAEAKSTYPSELDEKSLELEKLLNYHFNFSGPNGLTELAEDWLAAQPLSGGHLSSFLNRLSRPDVANLVNLIHRDMQQRRPFGSRSIDSLLTSAQLEQLAALEPALRNDLNFVTQVLVRQQPMQPLSSLEIKEQEKFYEAQWAFALTLAPVFNNLRSTLMFRVLEFEQSQGKYDMDKLQKYLELPFRSHPHINRFYELERQGQAVHWANLNFTVGQLRAPGRDLDLVTDFLQNWFSRPEVTSIDRFAPLLDNGLLTATLAATKLMRQEEKDDKPWLAMLGPVAATALRERVILEFTPDNKKFHDVKGDVTLTAYVKNVPSLVCKVFKINTRGYYRTKLQEIDTSINLDGLTPHEETTLHLEGTNPYHRVRRTFSFESMKDARGVFVVELLGNGKRCRALVRKGQITFLEHPSALGHLFKLFDETGSPVEGGTIWVNGHAYEPEAKTGLIVVPYTANPTNKQPMVLTTPDGSFSSLAHFDYLAENYSFQCGMFVDRESLLQKSQADLVIRPALLLNGQSVALSNIRKIALRIETTQDAQLDDRGQVNTTKTVDDLKLFDDKETVYEFSVPDNLRSVTFTLSVDVRVKSTGAIETLIAEQTFQLNSIDDSPRIDDFHLRYDAKGYSVLVLGKAGEPRPHRQVNVSLTHKWIVGRLQAVTLQTDGDGRVRLGHLENFTGVHVRTQETDSAQFFEATFAIPGPVEFSLPQSLQGREGVPIRIPYFGKATAVSASFFSLLETQLDNGAERFRHDLTAAHLELRRTHNDASLIVKDLKPGLYSLRFREFPNQPIVSITVAAGSLVMSEYLMEKNRFVQLNAPSVDNVPWKDHAAALNIVSITERKDTKEGGLAVQLAGFSDRCRVHVLTSHFVPEFSFYQTYSGIRAPAPRVFGFSRLPSVFLGTRDLGDEHQYILDRKRAKKYVGNMLPRPSLLLNERAKRDTTFTADPTLRASQAFERRHEGEEGVRYARHYGAALRDHAIPRHLPLPDAYTRNLEFLSDPSNRILNLRPDEKGVVVIPRSMIGVTHTHVLVVAVDGTANTVTRRYALPPYAADSKEAKEQAQLLALDAAYRDMRLMPGLDSSKHFTEHHLISTLPAGQTKVIEDIKTATVETFETLADVFSLFTTLAREDLFASPLLAKFDFVLNWPEFDREKKEEKYSEFACHELNFFLYNKDRDFFEEVIRPFLKNKLQKSFLDRWFLRMDVSEYTRPHEFSKLNALEQILLAFRVPSMHTRIAKLFSDKGATLPKDPERFIALFKTALDSRALDNASKPSTIPKAARQTRAEKEEMALEMARAPMMAMHMAQPAPMAPPMAAMGFSFGAAPGAPVPLAATLAAAPAPAALGGRAMRAKKMMARGAMAMDMALVEQSEANFDDLAAEMPESAVVRQLYQAPPTTKEYEERNYYDVSSGDTDAAAALIPLNEFWVDYAQHAAAVLAGEQKDMGAFLSRFVAVPTRTFTEMLMAISVLGLPFKASKHEVSGARVGKFTFKAGSPVVVFHKEVKETETTPSKVAVSQNYFDPSDAFKEEGDERVDKYIDRDFLRNHVYGCRVVLTNVSSTRQKVEVLLQIPQGAVPVTRPDLKGQQRKAFLTRTSFVELDSYSTQVVEYFFYFPALGRYSHYPVHVSRAGTVIGFGSPAVLEVVKQPTAELDLTSWKVISQEGTSAQVLDFLRTQNVHKLELRLAAWRLRDKEFYQQVLSVLRERLCYDGELWGYAFLHNDAHTMREFIERSQVWRRVGSFLRSALLDFDAEKYQWNQYQHLEYFPLLNARAHQLRSSGGFAGSSAGLTAAGIQNAQFKEQYLKFLMYLVYRAPSINEYTNPQLLAFTYYLLLQDRIEEAREMFGRVKIGERKGDEMGGEAELQYDYLTAYFEFFNPEGPKLALSLAKKYKNHPVPKKRKLFEELEQQLLEAQPSAVPDLALGAEGTAREREMANLAATEPSLDFSIEGGRIEIAYANVRKVTINFYTMDVELLFSTQPFIRDNDASTLFVAPNFSLQLDLPETMAVFSVEVPERFRTANAYVEIVGPASGLSRCKTMFSNSLNVAVIENYGQVKVTKKETAAPIPMAYVKVYSRNKNDGSVTFYKDGYTDRRGRFDYASLSTNKLPNVDKFSILVLTEGAEAVVREASPPAR